MSRGNNDQWKMIVKYGMFPVRIHGAGFPSSKSGLLPGSPSLPTWVKEMRLVNALKRLHADANPAPAMLAPGSSVNHPITVQGLRWELASKE